MLSYGHNSGSFIENFLIILELRVALKCVFVAEQVQQSPYCSEILAKMI